MKFKQWNGIEIDTIYKNCASVHSNGDCEDINCDKCIFSLTKSILEDIDFRGAIKTGLIELIIE